MWDIAGGIIVAGLCLALLPLAIGCFFRMWKLWVALAAVGACFLAWKLFEAWGAGNVIGVGAIAVLLACLYGNKSSAKPDQPPT